MGFNEQEVRTLIDYYKSYRELPHTTDELITIMKPWYDNYCFAMKALKEPSMYNSDMVLYFMNHYMLNEDIPDNMLDANIRTDYNKLRHLIHVDKTFGENASVVQEIVEKVLLPESLQTVSQPKTLSNRKTLKAYSTITAC